MPDSHAVALTRHFVATANHNPANHLEPVYYSSSEFGFSRKRISRAALQVIDGLQQAGFVAYLVGGCVRDLLMGFEPKDFDVTTDASPEQVQRLFERSRIVGRRFRLVHVRFGREVVEVATFRTNPSPLPAMPDNRHRWRKTASNNGRILDDNVYGTIEDDAVRRDFTVNALYYDPRTEQVIDFLGGVDDIERNLLKMIGDPEKRFTEDPVRMLRVLRFKAKLGLQPASALLKSITENSRLIADVPAARLFDEVLKMFHYAHAVSSWKALCDAGLAGYLFPQTMAVINQPGGEKWEKMMLYALENTDHRIRHNKPVIAAFLYAVLLWRPFSLQLAQIKTAKIGLNEAAWRAGDQVFAQQCKQVAVPRRASVPAIEVWTMQFGLETRRPKNIVPILANRRFRAAYDFLLLRAGIGEVEQSLVDWWSEIQNANEDVRSQTIAALRSGDRALQNQPTSRRKRKKPVATKSVGDTGGNIRC